MLSLCSSSRSLLLLLVKEDQIGTIALRSRGSIPPGTVIIKTIIIIIIKTFLVTVLGPHLLAKTSKAAT
jgi:hypothetical protein